MLVKFSRQANTQVIQLAVSFSSFNVLAQLKIVLLFGNFAFPLNRDNSKFLVFIRCILRASKQTSGCFRSAIKLSDVIFLPINFEDFRKSLPDTLNERGVPAASSTSIRHCFNVADILLAKSLFGVITVHDFLFSNASLILREIERASSLSDGASRIVIP